MRLGEDRARPRGVPGIDEVVDDEVPGAIAGDAGTPLAPLTPPAVTPSS
jgi:hypothetical protein